MSQWRLRRVHKMREIAKRNVENRRYQSRALSGDWIVSRERLPWELYNMVGRNLEICMDTGGIATGKAWTWDEECVAGFNTNKGVLNIDMITHWKLA